tara:strand:- start:2 stop:919 length:918 start_codon:yes stop_codon:yes gene_type:complete
MLKKYYTLLLFNEILDKPVKFRIHLSFFKYLIIFGFSSSFLFIGFTSYFVYLYDVASKEALKVNALRAENSSQKVQIQKFVNQVNEFEKNIKRVERLDRKMRVISAIDKTEEPKANMLGIGGSPQINMDDLNLSFNSSPLEKLSLKLERLKIQANLQEISLAQLDRFFKDRKSFLSSVPSIWPVRGGVTSGFGYRLSPYSGFREMHEGIDIATRLHSNIVSPADGFVIRADRNQIHGLILEIDHGYGFITRYAHNSKNLVKVGDRIKRGQLIAQSGNTGRSTGPHLHYAIFLKGIPVNPVKYIIE